MKHVRVAQLKEPEEIDHCRWLESTATHVIRRVVRCHIDQPAVPEDPGNGDSPAHWCSLDRDQTKVVCRKSRQRH